MNHASLSDASSFSLASALIFTMPLPSAFNFLRKDNIDCAPQEAAAQGESKIAAAEITPAPQEPDEHPEKYVPDAEAQNGVKKVEAITLSWSRAELIVAYISYVERP
jgi:hypothetical protein